MLRNIKLFNNHTTYEICNYKMSYQPGANQPTGHGTDPRVQTPASHDADYPSVLPTPVQPPVPTIKPGTVENKPEPPPVPKVPEVAADRSLLNIAELLKKATDNAARASAKSQEALGLYDDKLFSAEPRIEHKGFAIEYIDEIVPIFTIKRVGKSETPVSGEIMTSALANVPFFSRSNAISDDPYSGTMVASYLQAELNTNSARKDVNYKDVLAYPEGPSASENVNGIVRMKHALAGKALIDPFTPLLRPAGGFTTSDRASVVLNVTIGIALNTYVLPKTKVANMMNSVQRAVKKYYSPLDLFREECVVMTVGGGTGNLMLSADLSRYPLLHWNEVTFGPLSGQNIWAARPGRLIVGASAPSEYIGKSDVDQFTSHGNALMQRLYHQGNIKKQEMERYANQFAPTNFLGNRIALHPYICPPELQTPVLAPTQEAANIETMGIFTTKGVIENQMDDDYNALASTNIVIEGSPGKLSTLLSRINTISSEQFGLPLSTYSSAISAKSSLYLRLKVLEAHVNFVDISLPVFSSVDKYSGIAWLMDMALCSEMFPVIFKMIRSQFITVLFDVMHLLLPAADYVEFCNTLGVIVNNPIGQYPSIDSDQAGEIGLTFFKPGLRHVPQRLRPLYNWFQDAEFERMHYDRVKSFPMQHFDDVPSIVHPTYQVTKWHSQARLVLRLRTFAAVIENLVGRDRNTRAMGTGTAVYSTPLATYMQLLISHVSENFVPTHQVSCKPLASILLHSMNYHGQYIDPSPTEFLHVLRFGLKVDHNLVATSLPRPLYTLPLFFSTAIACSVTDQVTLSNLQEDFPKTVAYNPTMAIKDKLKAYTGYEPIQHVFLLCQKLMEENPDLIDPKFLPLMEVLTPGFTRQHLMNAFTKWSEVAGATYGCLGQGLNVFRELVKIRYKPAQLRLTVVTKAQIVPPSPDQPKICQDVLPIVPDRVYSIMDFAVSASLRGTVQIYKGAVIAKRYVSTYSVGADLPRFVPARKRVNRTYGVSARMHGEIQTGGMRYVCQVLEKIDGPEKWVNLTTDWCRDYDVRITIPNGESLLYLEHEEPMMMGLVESGLCLILPEVQFAIHVARIQSLQSFKTNDSLRLEASNHADIPIILRTGKIGVACVTMIDYAAIIPTPTVALPADGTMYKYFWPMHYVDDNNLMGYPEVGAYDAMSSVDHMTTPPKAVNWLPSMTDEHGYPVNDAGDLLIDQRELVFCNDMVCINTTQVTDPYRVDTLPMPEYAFTPSYYG
jgi:hypothetical protein